MRKIDTWLFITIFLFAFTGMMWLATFTVVPLFSDTLRTGNPYVAYGILSLITTIVCWITAFGLRSYYVLPASATRTASLIVAVQLVLYVLGMIFEIPSWSDVALSLLTSAASWVVVFFSFYTADTYFSKR